MSDDAQRTLFHPFETGEIDLPGRDARVLFLGAEPGFRLPEGSDAELTCVQGFRPSYLRLRAERRHVVTEPQGGPYDLALVLVEKHRGLSELRIAAALRRLSPEGLLVVAGAKDDGIASLRKRIETLTPLDGSLSKHHGIAFWLRRPADASAIATMLEKSNEAPLVAGRFRAAPGMFSHDRVDPGSRLLAENLPGDLTGAAADFCAGWGYLAAQVLDRCPAITSVDLFEADHAALEAARGNLEDHAARTAFHWIDLATEPVQRRFDAIVINPPFHQGRAGDPGIGEAMMRAASAALRPNGRLVMVANRHLPYEAALEKLFRQHREVVRDAGFKVLVARR